MLCLLVSVLLLQFNQLLSCLVTLWQSQRLLCLSYIYIYELPMSLNIFRVDTRPRFGLLNLAL